MTGSKKQPQTYEESLEWIHSKLKFGIKPGLKRVEWLLNQLGNPQEQIKGVHIVGTNGKGSTVANLQHILTVSGYKVGSFTSPYIRDFRERISVDGQMISQEALVDLVDRVYTIVERLPQETGLEPATEFEVITVMMFLYFAEIVPVDLVLVEAGLGGRLDSTNVFTPMMVLCPSIGLDHQAILGDSHAEIAAEKAGVMKSGVPFVFATDREDVREVFRDCSKRIELPLLEAGVEFSLTNGFYQDQAGNTIEDIQPGLPGQHQVLNASLAIKASLLLAPQFPKISETSIREGLRASRWVGRTELMTANLMIDGAHNQESVRALCDLLKEEYSDKKLVFLVAAIAGKPIDGMLNQLADIGQVTVTTFDYPAALQLSEYPDNFVRVPSFKDWLGQIQDNEDQFFVVTGSLYFISQVRQWLSSKDSQYS